MKLHLIQQYIADFDIFLQNSKTIDSLYYYKIVDNWQKNWNLNEENLAVAYDKSLFSHDSNHLWGGSYNSPKSQLKLLIETNPSLMKIAFSDLFDEKLDVGLRIQRFSEYCDVVLEVIKKREKNISTHFHNDKKYACLYLALQFPTKYCLWDYVSFATMMKAFESNNYASEFETERYYKTMGTIFSFIQKDENILHHYHKYLKPLNINIDNPLAIMNDFAIFISAKKKM